VGHFLNMQNSSNSSVKKKIKKTVDKLISLTTDIEKC
jgi:hypothetical protein